MSKKLHIKGIYSDGMVLQRNTTNCIFGTAEKNAEVSLSIKNVSASTNADENGNWKIEYNPGQPGGPFTLKISSQDEEVSFKEVFVGEVWLSSGQSNAQLPMERMKFSYPEEFALPENANIRMITIPISWSFEGEKDTVENPTWICASPETLGLMSGTAYFFAKKLWQELGVPVGIINASQGGSPIAAWMDKTSLKQLDNTESFIEQLETYENPDNISKKQKELAENQQKWDSNINETDRGGKESWEKLTYAEIQNDWGDCVIPGFIDHKETAGFFWFKKQIELTAEQVKHFDEIKTWIWFGTIVDADKVWINGVKVGETGYCYPPRRYVVPKGTLKAGYNTITIRVQKNSHFGKIRFYTEKPYYLFTENVRVIPTAIRNVEQPSQAILAADSPTGSEKINLSGQWKMKMGTAVEDCPPGMFFEWVPTALFNAMLAPCFNYAIAGTLWYQGESDAWHPDEYRGMLMKMIMLWRKKFVYAQKDMPFVIMQLPNWSDGFGEDYCTNTMNWAQMRQEQLLVTEIVENTGIAITIDAGEWNDLHPEKKRTGGTRAALEALRIGYGKKINIAPKAVFTERKNDDFIIQFDTGTAKLKTFKGDEIPGFYFQYEIENHLKMVEAKGRIISDNEVAVPVPQIDGVFREIRYLWSDSPNPINLYSTDDLPAQAFRAIIPQ